LQAIEWVPQENCEGHFSRTAKTPRNKDAKKNVAGSRETPDCSSRHLFLSQKKETTTPKG